MSFAPPDQNRDREGAATAYLLTWVCYGSWAPGQSGAVPRKGNQYGAPLPESDARAERQSRNRMAREAYLLDAARRQAVLESLQEVCSCRGWVLWAAHVRTNHVHVVVTANRKPEQVMNAIKAYSSRAIGRYRQEASDLPPLGAARQHTLPVDGRRGAGGHRVRGSGTRDSHGCLRSHTLAGSDAGVAGPLGEFAF
jgi:hypothetical protein